jgi:hypothetical protein
MVIVELATGLKKTVAVSPVESKDFKQITKKRYAFDWKKERGVTVMFKLTIANQSDILGLVSTLEYPGEFRSQIHLICASDENVGKNKRFKGIVGCLIGFVGQLALKKYGGLACISLLPKTELRDYYKKQYGMMDGGPQLFLDGIRLQAIVNKYAS